MSVSRTLRWLAPSFRTHPITSCAELLITKKTVCFDYLAIDVNGLVGNALRLSKGATTEPRRQREVARQVLNSLQQLLRKISGRKSLLIAMDGAEALAKAAVTRRGALTRRLEGRLARLPGTPLMQAVEERLARTMPGDHQLRTLPSEVVLSGTCVTGCVEEKFTAWALDLACREKFNTNENSLCLIGGSELVYGALALTPYYNVRTVVQGTSDYKQTTLASLLAWLELDEMSSTSPIIPTTTTGGGVNSHHASAKAVLDGARLASARTDAVWLLLLCQGCTTTELPAATDTPRFPVLWARYMERAFGLSEPAATSANIPSTSMSSSAGWDGVVGLKKKDENSHQSRDFFALFRDLPGHTLELDVANFLAVLGVDPTDDRSKGTPEATKVSRISGASRSFSASAVCSTSFSLATAAYLEHLLQTQAMLCLGYTPNPFHGAATRGGAGEEPDSSNIASIASAPHTRSLQSLISYLRGLYARGVRVLRPQGPSFSPPNPLECLAEVKKTITPTTTPEEDTPVEFTSLQDGKSTSKVDTKMQAGSWPLKETKEDREMASSSSLGEKTNSMTTLKEDLVDVDEVILPPPPPPPSAIGVYYPFWTPLQPLTAAEFTILCQPQAAGVESGLQLYVGHNPRAERVKRILNAPDLRTAHELVQESLSYADPVRPHKCLCLSPSYCWIQNERTRTWRMEYVDIGTRARAKEIRQLRNGLPGTVRATQRRGEDENDPVAFDGASQQWQSIRTFPCGAERTEDAAQPALEAATEDVKGGMISKEPVPTEAGAQDSLTPPPPVTTPPPIQLKVLTWNVMFDRYSGQTTPLGMPGIDWCSPQRYPVLAKRLAAEDADVVGMQEVEPAFLEFLAAQPWCRARYVLSCPPSSPVIHPWGIVMLLHRRRYPVLGLRYVNVPAWAGHLSLMPVVTLGVAGAPVHISAVHLLAPFNTAHANARATQDAALRHRLSRSLPANEDSIAMGDFNDFPGSEFDMPASLQYVEGWPLLHPHDPGYTMDDRNTFCKLKVEAMFFGRSDKIFARSRRLRPVEAHLVGTKSVNEENGNEAAPAYLFPSDHYGVSMTFALA